MAYELTKEFSFHAAHSLTALPKEHKCSHMHGHTYRVLITVRGELDPELGWVVDFGIMAKEAQRLHAMLDHKYLNEIPGIGLPTSENLARFIYEHIKPVLDGLISITVFETPTSYCVYSPLEDGVKVGIGPMQFSATHVVVSKTFEEPLHGHDFSVRIEFYTPYTTGITAKDKAKSLLESLVATYNHKVLLPERPAIGTLDTGDNVVFSWQGRALTLKQDDVKFLDSGHATAEAVCQELFNEIKALLLKEDVGFYDLKVSLQEEPGTLVTMSGN